MKPALRWGPLERAGRLLSAALFVLGTFAAAVHSHPGATEEPGCVVCALAHSPAEAPQVVAVPVAAPVVQRADVAAPHRAPRCAPRRRRSPRAPPES